MAATSYYSTKEDKTLNSSGKYARRKRQRELRRRRIYQRRLIISSGAIIAAMITVVAATTGALHRQASVPVESIPQSVTQESSSEAAVSTITSTVESTVETTTVETITSTPTVFLLPKSTIPVFKVSLTSTLQEYTYETCERYKVSDYYTLVIALMWVESRYDASSISATHDYGLMQINVCNHKYLREKLGVSDFLDAQDNIQAGVYMLSGYILEYGDVHKALMAYNMGSRGASKLWNRGIYSSAYSRHVVAAWKTLKETGTINE